MKSRARLHIGPAGSSLSGWVNVGAGDDPRAEITTDLAVDGLPFAGGAISAVSLLLVLHRFTPYEGLGILKELRRVLAPGGILQLSLIDFDRALDAYRNGGSGLWCHAWASPAGNLITQILEHGNYRTPYTVEFATELLGLAGFADVRTVAQTAGDAPGNPRQDVRGEELFHLQATAPAPAARWTRTPAPRLCWTDDPRTSVSLVWTTDSSDGGWVEAQQGGGWRRHRPHSVPGRWGGFVHTAEITALPPGQELRCRSSGGAALTTRTAPADSAARFLFAFVCDTGIEGRQDGLADGVSAVIEELVDEDPLFVLGGGDYAYADTDDRFEDAGVAVDAWIEQFRRVTLRCPMVLQYGNHEVALGERWRDYAELVPGPGLALGGRCQSFDVGAAHLTGVFVPEEAVDVEVVQWLEDDLLQARAAGARWLVVWQHAPLFASGSAHPASPRLRRHLGPTLERHAVDLHLSGHDQNYERTFPLQRIAGIPRITSSSENRYRAGSGVVYAKVSPGGKHSNRGRGSRIVGPVPDVVACWNDDAHHLALVTVDGEDRLEVEVRALRPGRPTEVVDHFVVVRGD